MTGWMWIALGLVLAAIELATPGGFFIIFFGVGAVVVGLMELAGLLDCRPGRSGCAFPIVALVALRLFRQPLLARLQPRDSRRRGFARRRRRPAGRPHSSPGGHGKAELRGALWTRTTSASRAVGARDSAAASSPSTA